MAEILIKTINHCVGNPLGGKEVTLPAGRVVTCEESLARSFIELGGAQEANESDLLQQDLNDKMEAEFQARLAGQE